MIKEAVSTADFTISTASGESSSFDMDNAPQSGKCSFDYVAVGSKCNGWIGWDATGTIKIESLTGIEEGSSKSCSKSSSDDDDDDGHSSDDCGCTEDQACDGGRCVDTWKSTGNCGSKQCINDNHCEDGKRCCLVVDELLNQQQVVIKSLGDGLGRVQGFSGGSIMGDGKVSLILDIPGLMKLSQG